MSLAAHSQHPYYQPLKLSLMPTRPFNTLTLEEVLVLLNTPAFYQFLEIAYDMYQLWQVMVLITTGQFAMPNDPPGPAIDSVIGW